MTNNDETRLDPNTRLPSTIFVWKRVKLSPHPPGDRQPAKPSTSLPRRRRRRELNTPVQVVMTYVGGPEGSITLRQNGFSWRYHGGTALIDVLQHWQAVKP